MRKNIIKILIAISIVIAISCILLLLNNNNKDSEKTNSIQKTLTTPKLLAVNSYSNYAWSVSFSGTAIFSDGSIYTWQENNNSKIKKYDIHTTEGLEEFILEEGKLKSKKVSNNDLKNLKKYVNLVKDEIEITYPGADMGTSTTYIINKKGEKITLKRSGDSEGKNKTDTSKKILNIIDKYL